MDLPQTRAREAGWLHQAGLRLRARWPVKMTGTALIMAGFFPAYFLVLHHPLFSVFRMPVTAVDRWVKFQPEMLPLYLSLWIYVSLAPALLVGRREIISYAAATIGMAAMGLGIFILWPTTVWWPENWPQHTAFSFLKAVDESGNACPSLHVAFAVFSARWLGRLLRQMGAGKIIRAFNWLWCLGILYSTIAIRQHVVLDVLAGAALGAMVAAMQWRWLRGSVEKIGAESTR